MGSVKRHILRIHNGDNSGNINEVSAPTTMYVGDNDPPNQMQTHTYANEDYNVNNIQNQHNTQYGNGHNTHIPIEKYNEVVGIVQQLKQHCEVKDNAIRVRDTFLTGNNSKLQDEITIISSEKGITYTNGIIFYFTMLFQ